jgi:flagellin-like protein
MKGISPLIATILLIAFTVAVGGIVSLWITGYSKTQTTQISQTSQDQIQCYNSVLSIKSVDWDAPILRVTMGYDSGSLTLYNPVVDSACGAISNTNSSTFVSSITPGEIFVVQINMSDCTTKPDFLRIRLTCMGPTTQTNFTIATQCEKGQGCGL